METQRTGQTVDAGLRHQAEDLPVSEVLEDFRDARQVEAALPRAEEPEDRSHRAAGDQRRLQPGGLEQGECSEVHVPGAASAAADEHELALAHFAIEPIRRQPMASL